MKKRLAAKKTTESRREEEELMDEEEHEKSDKEGGQSTYVTCSKLFIVCALESVLLGLRSHATRYGYRFLNFLLSAQPFVSHACMQVSLRWPPLRRWLPRGLSRARVRPSLSAHRR